MKTYLLIGRTGVGKSSFVNATFGVQLAHIDDYEACTTIVEAHSRTTDFGAVCLIDTPGLAEHDGKFDEKYLGMIKERLAMTAIEALLYLTPLSEPRFRPEEQTALEKLTKSLGGRVWRSSMLILTFAASVAPERVDETAFRRERFVSSFIVELTTAAGGMRFSGFRQVLLVDNVVPNWNPGCRPLASFLT
jgi:GTPase Era involved in 16S rRNA processing